MMDATNTRVAVWQARGLKGGPRWRVSFDRLTPAGAYDGHVTYLRFGKWADYGLVLADARRIAEQAGLLVHVDQHNEDERE